jgi:uncharacterized protein (TIGR02246 family)
MTREAIHELIGRRLAAWTARDAAALAATHAPAGTVSSPTGGVLEGRPEIERVYRIWLTAFPDLVFEPIDLLIDGNRAVQIARVAATHSGDFFGLAPTGRRLEVQVALLLTVADGLVRDERRIYDFTGVLVQIGVLKAKPAPG